MDAKRILVLAAVVLRKFGACAPHVALSRARMHDRIDDGAAADIWSAVAASLRLHNASVAARRMRGPPLRPPSSLDEVLSGSVTRRVLDAHGSDAAKLRCELRSIARRRPMS